MSRWHDAKEEGKEATEEAEKVTVKVDGMVVSWNEVQRGRRRLVKVQRG